ncbi:MAG TPA: hypothetical protein VJP07_05375 [Dehalococcoidia bacterium]|nr:hypothetical protein [Dehalococcoidia bacterium]
MKPRIVRPQRSNAVRDRAELPEELKLLSARFDPHQHTSLLGCGGGVPVAACIAKSANVQLELLLDGSQVGLKGQ